MWYKKAQQYIGYHGTNQGFTTFQIGQEFQDQKSHTSAAGFWFTDSIDEAQEYADYSAERTVPNQIEHEKKIREYLHKIQMAKMRRDWDLEEKLTMEMEALESEAMYDDTAERKIIEAILTLNNPYKVDASQEGFDPRTIIDFAKKNGHDGVIFYNMFDSPKMFSKLDKTSTTQYLVFDESNIKIRRIL